MRRTIGKKGEKDEKGGGGEGGSVLPPYRREKGMVLL